MINQGKTLRKSLIHVFAFSFLIATVASQGWEAALYTDLFTGYNKNVRPSESPTDQLTAHLSFSLARIESLDEKDQVLKSFGWMVMVWTDVRLMWDPADYNGTTSLVVDGDLIWIPEIAMLNSVDKGTDLTLNNDFRVSIFFNGLVTWGPGFKWATSCKVNLRYFPFDTQKCEVQFINWMYTAESVNLTHESENVDTSYYVTNGEWELKSAKVGRRDLVADMPTGRKDLPVVAFQLKLKRYPQFLTWNLLVPAFIMTIMSLLVFCLPAEAGEKVSLGITVLLSYSVVLLMVSDITPRASDVIPILTIYLIISMGLTAVSLFSSVLVLATFHKGSDTPVPKWIKVLVLRHLAFALCMRRDKDKPSPGSGKVWAQKVLPEEDELSENSAKPAGAAAVIPQDIIEYIRDLQARDKETERELVNKSDWEAVSRVIDRFFFAAYLLVIIVITSVMFGMIIDGDDDAAGGGNIYIVS